MKRKLLWYLTFIAILSSLVVFTVLTHKGKEEKVVTFEPSKIRSKKFDCEKTIALNKKAIAMAKELEQSASSIEDKEKFELIILRNEKQMEDCQSKINFFNFILNNMTATSIASKATISYVAISVYDSKVVAMKLNKLGIAQKTTVWLSRIKPSKNFKVFLAGVAVGAIAHKGFDLFGDYSRGQLWILGISFFGIGICSYKLLQEAGVLE